MDKDKTWWWYRNKPRKIKAFWVAERKTEDDMCFVEDRK